MIPLSLYKNRCVVVVGLGLSGQSTVRALTEAGAHVYAWDDHPGQRQEASANGCPLKAPEDFPWEKIEALILSPSIPHTYPHPHLLAQQAMQYEIPILCDVDLFGQYIASLRPKREEKTLDRHLPPNPCVIGVTGTNGKSTTTALITHVLRSAGRSAQMGGNIGIPVLDLDPPPQESQSDYVLELSSYQLERCPHLHVDIAVWLNIAPDHLSRHGGIDGYVKAKMNLFHFNHPQLIFISIDDPQSRSARSFLSSLSHKTIIPLSTYPSDGAGVEEGQNSSMGLKVQNGYLIDSVWKGPLIDLLKTAPHLPGTHNHQNILAAYGVVRSLGVSSVQFIEGLKSFRGLPHRLERLPSPKWVKIINDSKATNPHSTAHALSLFQNIYWIVGGAPKENKLEGLEPYFSKIARAYLIGAAAKNFQKLLQAHHVPTTLSQTLFQAVPQALKDAQAALAHSIPRLSGNKRKKDLSTFLSPFTQPVVLLSPACASWDQFNNFEHRGDCFRTLVQGYFSEPTPPE